MSTLHSTSVSMSALRYMHLLSSAMPLDWHNTNNSFLKRNRERLVSSPANYSLKLKDSSGNALPDPVRNFSYEGKDNWTAFDVVILSCCNKAIFRIELDTTILSCSVRYGK